MNKETIINCVIGIGLFFAGIFIGYNIEFPTGPYTLVTEATGVNKTLYIVSDKNLMPVQGELLLYKSNLGKSKIGVKK